jgi:peroxiredoxin
MIELVQLEKRHEDFAKRNVDVVAASVEDPDAAKESAKEFPHLKVVSDPAFGLSRAAGLVHEHGAPDGSDIDMPTTILVNGRGVVRWLYRSPSVVARLSPDDVLSAVDRHLK